VIRKFGIKNKGNGFVINSLMRVKKHKNVTQWYILNLSIADISFLLFCITPTSYIYTIDEWPFGKISCKLYHYLSFVTVSATSATMMAMTIGIFLNI
jgi:hypothetical protein